MSNILNKICKGIKSPGKVRDYLKVKYLIASNNPKQLSDFLYYKTFEKHINWDSPEDLNQWIAWLQFNTDTTLWSTLADKYRMHDYLREKGYGDLLVPVLAKWESADDIDLSELPDGFVLKCNNGSGDVRVVKDKSKVDINEIKAYFRQQMARKFGRDGAEPHYLRIKPLIIAEKLLDATKQASPSTSLIDYKFWCFDGKIDRILVCSDRKPENYAIELFDADWNNISAKEVIYDAHTHPSDKPLTKPKSFETMKKIALELSKGIPELRLDFYEIDGQPYIGEFTFTGAAGRMTHYSQNALEEMGKLCGEAVQKLVESGEIKVLDRNSLRGGAITSTSLIDYKFWCFNGDVDRVFVCSDRTKEHFTIDLYDKSWNRIVDGNLNFDNHHLRSESGMPKPANFERMVEVASEISKGFPQIRVDFYEVDNQIYIGELTMTSACGRMDYFTEPALKAMGAKCAKGVKELTETKQLQTI